MTKASENPYPSVNMEEIASDGSTLANADSDYRRLFLGEDGALHLKDSAGTVTDVANATGAVATDAIWDAAGDLAVGSGANTASVLGKGAAGGVLAMGNSAVIWNSGTSFPASKATGDRYWRSDLGMEFFWDGTRWVTTTLHSMNFGTQQAVAPWSATTAMREAMPHPTLDIWAVTFYAATLVATTNDGSKYWTISFDATATVLSTINNTAAALTIESAAIGAAVAGGTNWLTVSVTKVSTPGTLFAPCVLLYRLIAT